jgi:hypothetical protein
MAEGGRRFREPKTVEEEVNLVQRATPSSRQYKNKWAVNIFNEWHSARRLKVPVVEPGGLFKEYELYKVSSLPLDALSLNYCLSKFVMEL